MPKSLLAIYLVTSFVDVSFGLQVQSQTDLANLRNDQGRTTELEWTWTEADGDNCDTACESICPGAVCDSLDMGEIDSTNKMADLEYEMGTSVCTSYSGVLVADGPFMLDGVCYASLGAGYASCSVAAAVGLKYLCPCEVVLGTCTVAEDPHISVFDDAQISLLAGKGKGKLTDGELLGDKWLVKSARVKIQARFGTKGDDQNTNPFTRAVALSGEILNNNILVIGSLEDQSTWNGEGILSGQESSFYMRDGSFFVNVTRGASSLVQDPSQNNLGINIRLPSGVSLIVNRLHHYINAVVRMPAQAGGQEGLCGNFNGLGTDDALEMINNRMDPTVMPEESLFAGLAFD